MEARNKGRKEKTMEGKMEGTKQGREVYAKKKYPGSLKDPSAAEGK